MEFPTINLNGSHGPTLLEDHLRVYDLLREALRELQKLVPHGRDYPGFLVFHVDRNSIF